MTAQPHASLASAITTWACYGAIFGGLILCRICCAIQDRRLRREREREHRLQVLAYEAWECEQQQPLICDERTIRLPSGRTMTVVRFDEPTRLPSYYACEQIWDETLSYGLEPDRDLLAEWKRAR